MLCPEKRRKVSKVPKGPQKTLCNAFSQWSCDAKNLLTISIGGGDFRKRFAKGQNEKRKGRYAIMVSMAMSRIRYRHGNIIQWKVLRSMEAPMEDPMESIEG